MTQEEKAKRYDEVVKEIKGFFEGKQKMPNDVDKTLELLFPELKESEDEKIRKALICGMYALKEQYKTCFASIPIDDCIAWLEKQESDYTFEIKEGHWYKCVCDYMLNGSDLMFKNDRLYYCRSNWRLSGEIDERNVKDIGVSGYKSFFRPATNQEIKDWLEKQGDKNELIKELDEYKAKYTQEVLEKHLRAMNKDDERLRKTTIAFLKDFADKGYENAIECIDWLEKQGEQKPQGKTALEAINEEKVDNSNRVEPKDYSSIDPHFFKPTDKIVEKYNITGIGSKHAQGKLGEMIKNLKSINERLEQKITCGKEDETSIAVNNPDAYKIGFADGEAHAKEEQWKPSDEQIKHLTYVVYDAKHKNRISTNGYEPYSYLYALLMQLKKLKG